MSCSTKKKVAVVVATMVAVLWISGMLYYSEGFSHYWVDESPAPDYVRHDRTPMATAGVVIFNVSVGCVATLLVYFVIQAE